MNISSIMEAKSKAQAFAAAHPRFVAFFKDLSANGVEENSILDVTVTRPDGSRITTNMRVTAQDLELFRTLKQMQS